MYAIRSYYVSITSFKKSTEAAVVERLDELAEITADRIDGEINTLSIIAKMVAGNREVMNLLSSDSNSVSDKEMVQMAMSLQKENSEGIVQTIGVVNKEGERNNFV